MSKIPIIWQIDLGPIVGEVSDVPLPPCPLCGGTIESDESGSGTDAKKCQHCEHQFQIEAAKNRAYLIWQMKTIKDDAPEWRMDLGPLTSTWWAVSL